ncbi:Abi-alpha family protein [Mucilaginibacter sp.]|uniref:Abi-alpha family protein n=1 Tax=Mucilaginibacter sp. TaxID=1882438 RepID=UPI0025CF56BC|nr:Abi-alpha family protein [Mucilaginibacter sp.]
MSPIDIKSSTIDKSLDLIKSFVQKLIGPAVDEIGEMFADHVKIWRLKNQIRNLEKVKKIIDANHIPIQNIPIKVLLPYLEGVSLEEDNLLQDIWANLLINYIDARKNLTQTIYPQILKQLSSDDVRYLQILKKEGYIYVGRSQASENKVTAEDLSNLERMHLVTETIGINKTDYQYGEYEPIGIEEYTPTLFALGFMRACGITGNEAEPSTTN